MLTWASAMRVDRRHAARPAVGERARRRATPTSAGPAPAPTRRRRRRRRRRGRGRSASPTPGCRGRSPTCRRSGRRSTATASPGRRPCRAPRRAGRWCGRVGGEAIGDRRLGAAVERGDLGVVGLPVVRDLARRERRQRDARRRASASSSASASSPARLHQLATRPVLGEQLERADALGQAVRHRRDHQLGGLRSRSASSIRRAHGVRAVADDAVRRHRPGDLDVGVHGRLVGRQQRRAAVRCGCRGSPAGPGRRGARPARRRRRRARRR